VNVLGGGLAKIHPERRGRTRPTLRDVAAVFGGARSLDHVRRIGRTALWWPNCLGSSLLTAPAAGPGLEFPT
jgi:hypothetical protein